MGKADNGAGREEGGKRKNKARMSYLKQSRQSGGWGRGRGRGGGGSGSNRGSVDSFGYKSGDYVSSYNRGHGGHQKSKRRPRTDLAPGMKGFICTTNFRESDCVREAYNLLNEYHLGEDGLPVSRKIKLEPGQGEEPVGVSTENKDVQSGIGNETLEGAKNVTEDEKEAVVEKPRFTVRKEDHSSSEDDDNDNHESEGMDIEEAMKKEIAELKSDHVRKRFQCVDTGVKNVVFISSTIDDPNEITYRIFEDIVAKREPKSRHILRFLPIAATCHSDLNAIQKVCKELFEKDFKEGYKSFKIVVNIRNNTKMSKGDVIKTLAEVVSEVNPLNFVDLNNPVYTITAEILKTVFCVSVVKDFFKFKKFNLVEASTPDKPDEPEEKVGIKLEPEEKVGIKLEPEEKVSVKLEPEEKVGIKLEPEEKVGIKLEPEEKTSVEETKMESEIKVEKETLVTDTLATLTTTEKDSDETKEMDVANAI